ncbi:unnamed protein product [Ambrosiozyma monospora]|uniref:Unnamed protein product n=1 Tax=Ambrosiozyma monospora TaxID=43982 RepID=A0ACB5T6T2_AMBMO|nr:unnamed protein product [Ambrosiozyma monospora]
MSLTVAYYILKKFPPQLSLIILFVNAFLLISLLTGCTTSGAASRSTHLVEYTFNQQSTMFNIMENAFSNDTFDLSELSIRVGYLGYCVTINDDSRYCGFTKNMKDMMSEIPKVSLYNSKSNLTSSSSSSSSGSQNEANLDIIKISESINNNLIKPYFLIAVIIFNLIVFLVEIYSRISEHFAFPHTKKVKWTSFVLQLICFLVWLMGSIWYWLVVKTSYETDGLSSFNLLKIEKGSKASALTWVSLCFFLVVLLFNIFKLARFIRAAKKLDDLEVEKIGRV